LPKIQIMRLIDFKERFGTEEQCKAAFRAFREEAGVVCKKCGATKHYWLERISKFSCANCRARQTLRSGTMLENTKLPYHYWFTAMHLITSTKKGFSALEVQHQIGHKRYEPIWAMLHKIRSVMGKRDNEHHLEGQVEIDEAFFEVAYPSDKPTKPGRGAKGKGKVLVMASAEPIVTKKQKKGKPKTKCKYISMSVLPNLKTGIIEEAIKRKVKPSSKIVTDEANAYNYIHMDYEGHEKVQGSPKEKTAKLPWVHICISNAKRKLLDIHHCISDKYLQRYLDEFCYKLNRRFLSADSMLRLLTHSVSYPPIRLVTCHG
jgi:transposase-like protein